MSINSHTHSSACTHSNGGRMTNSAPHLNVASLKGMSVTQFFGVRQGMTLTNCCVCNLPLEDAQSVSDGIGPICSRKYGYHTHVPTQQAIAACMGHLALLPIAADMQVMSYLLANQGDERKFANILVAYCSHLTSKGRDIEVFDYTPAIAALGLTYLSEQLALSRCPIRVVPNTVEGTRIGTPIAGEYVIKFDSSVSGSPNLWDLKRKYGFSHTKSSLKGVGRGNRWLVDQANLDLLLWAIAGSAHGGTSRVWNCGTVITLPQQSAMTEPASVTAYKARFAPTTPVAPTPSSIGLSVSRRSGRNGAFYTVSLPPFWNLGFWKPQKSDQKPFWTAMKDDLKRSTRSRWNPTHTNWVVDGSKESELFAVIQRHLGFTRQQLGC